MIKDSFQVKECESSSSQTWVTLISKEPLLSQKANEKQGGAVLKEEEKGEETRICSTEFWEDQTVIATKEEKTSLTETKAKNHDNSLKSCSEKNEKKVEARKNAIPLQTGKRDWVSKVKQLGSTLGIIFFFIAATSCLVLGGAMVGRIFQQDSVAQIVAFYEKMHHISHVAALGNVAVADLMLEEYEEPTQKTMKGSEVRHVRSFVEVMKALTKADGLAFAGSVQAAVQLLQNYDLSELEHKENKYAKKSFDGRIEVYKKMSRENKSAVKLVKSIQRKIPSKNATKLVAKIPASELWIKAVSMYKAGNHKESCALIENIANYSHSSHATKARSFFDRRCR